MTDDKSRYLVVDKDGKGHLPVKDENGKVNHNLMGAAWAALHGGYRGNKYEGPGKEEALRKLKAFYKSEGMELPSETSSDGSTYAHGSSVAHRPEPLGPESRDEGRQSKDRPDPSLLQGQSEEVKTGRESKDRHIAILLNGLGKLFWETGAEGTEPLYEIPVALTGAWVKGERKFSITAEDLADMVRNFDKRKNEQVVIDYEHASEMPEVARGGPVPAAGWIRGLKLAANGNGGGRDVPPERLYALVEWTPQAKDMIKDGEYRFFSPAIDWGAKDKETGEPQGATLTSGALTNHPFLEELPPIVMSDLFQEMAGVHQDGFMQGNAGILPTNTAGTAVLQGGTMAKKVKLAKVAGFPGKRKVTADDGVELGEFDLEDLEMDDSEFDDLASKRGKTFRAPAGIGQGGKMEDTLSELFVETGVGSREEAVKLLKPAKQLGVERIESVTRSVAFSECLKDGAINLDVAAELADRGRLGMKDFRQIQKAQELVEKSIREGKFTPADREFISRLALSDTAKFEDWAKKKPVVVPLGGPTGVSGAAESTTPDRELDLRLSELMREKKLDRNTALTELARTDPALIAKYRQAPAG